MKEHLQFVAMPELRKESLLRLASLSTIDDFSTKEEKPYGRAFQILEVVEWLEYNIESFKWFNTRPYILTSNMIETFAYKIGVAFNLPCHRLLEQVIFYIEKIKLIELNHQLNTESRITCLACIFWIFCTSNYSQLLILIFGLYDTENKGSIDEITLIELIGSMFQTELDFYPDISKKANDQVFIFI